MGNDQGKEFSSVDFIAQAKNHYDLIQEFIFNPHLFHPTVVEQSVARYEKYWLPFLSNHIQYVLVAPIDIELVWIAHMHNPTTYQRDTQKIAGQVLPHTILSREQRTLTDETINLWKSFFGPDISYHLDTKKTVDVFYQSKLSSDLVPAVEDYRLFCRQVALPHYKDVRFLQTAIFNYRNDAITGDFSKTAFPYHKAFIWKTHMLNPISYLQDESALHREICDRVNYHTQQAKRKTFYNDDSNTPIPGAMFRGTNTSLIPLLDIENIAGNSSEYVKLFQLKSYTVNGFSMKNSYRIELRAFYHNSNEEEILLQFAEGGKNVTLSKSFSEDMQANIFEFDFRKFRNVSFVLVEFPLNSLDSIVHRAEVSLPMDQNLVKDQELKIGIQFSKQNRLRTLGLLVFRYLKSGHDDLIKLKISKGKAYNHLNYCTILKAPKMMAPYAVKHESTPCSYIESDILNAQNKQILRCRILKTHLGDFISVEIFDLDGRVIGSSYTIGKESLPTYSQVSKPEACCIYREGFETVFVIRSTNYDWGLLKVFPNNSTPQKMLFCNLKTKNHRWQEIYNSDSNSHIMSYVMGESTVLQIDMHLSTFIVTLKPHEFPELVALGSTILNLFRLEKIAVM